MAPDLIDTLWNVKEILQKTGFQSDLDLIDTLWNVKLLRQRNFLKQIRFNRYIVECKVVKSAADVKAMNAI